ncbi:OsmC family protein [Athalassotoga saccharophila]|uniref:OsmC family protein n=1 Tax=Athalassotoga saccharophila TaxID=1441386 RepID=UPI00137A2F7C|nr:OsmC family protein [Athalassotoga saccharophila]BBJ29035.1 osmC-like protein [Athalassotoga saccharophila]
MKTFKIKEDLVQDGIAIAQARDIKVISDVRDDGTHPYGFSPAEIIGNALGSCLLINAQRIAKKMRMNFSDLSIDLNVYRQEDIPKVVKIEYTIHIKTDGSEEQLEKLFDYTSKYSTTYNTLKDSVEIFGKIERVEIENIEEREGDSIV